MPVTRSNSYDKTAVRLIVQADDFGGCRAMSDGILRCFEEGVITQASVIVPAPDAERAVQAARSAGLPLGVHLALLCEWEGLRWGPLTSGDSLRATDGAFLDDLSQLRARASVSEAKAELQAQIAAVRAAGVAPRHLDSHVRVYDGSLLADISAEFGLPCRDEVPAPGISMALDSLWHLSTRDPATKTQELLNHVAHLGPGLHMVVAHPAEDRPELLELCARESRRWKWARDIRVSDMTALRDPRFQALCDTRMVELVGLPER